MVSKPLLCCTLNPDIRCCRCAEMACISCAVVENVGSYKMDHLVWWRHKTCIKE